MNVPVVMPEGRLDFRPPQVELPDVPGPWRAAWSARLPVQPGRSRLLAVEGGLALVNAPAGIVALGDGPPGEERLLGAGRIAARPGVDGGALLFDEAGRLYRWAPGEAPRRVWDTGAPWNQLEAIALAGGRLLVQRPRGGALRGLMRTLGAGWVTELVEPAAGVRWSHGGDLRGVLPWQNALFAVREDRRRVARLDADNGVQRWEQTAADGLVATLVAVVEDKLWLTTHGGEIVALDAATGATAARLRLPEIAVPEGAVDASGRLHLCTGVRYTVLDLAAGGAVVADGPLSYPGAGPSLAFGRAALPTIDGRLVFADRNGRVLAARAGAGLTLLWRSTVPLLDCRAAHGSLFVLDRDGVLTAVRP